MKVLSQWLPLLILLLPLITTAAAADVNYRLDTDVKPLSYDVWLKPYLLPVDGAKRFTFDGNLNLTFQASALTSNEITLHKYLLDIANVSLYNSMNQLLQIVPLTNLNYQEVTHKLTLQFGITLTPNAVYTLNFVYVGQIRDGLSGLFRANYTDIYGIERWIGVTQSQRIDARSIFPCFDEPAMKAKFRLKLSRPAQYKTVFNTRLVSTEDDGKDRQLDEFAWTPVMSTYLFAFILSQFVATGDNYVNVVTRPEYGRKTDFALEVANRALNAYDTYTKLPYLKLGNDILQNAGSPKFPHNGMENWGLIIYSDAVLVNEPGYTDDWPNKEYTISVIVHEIAHMWFGNSVTFAWWSYFWLNEAFARYYQYFMAHQLYPEYQLDQQFVVNQLQMIFGTDATNSTQPMTSVESEIQTPSQIGYKFSSIAYAKGACIVRMFANIMGTSNYDNAIRAYLKEYQGNSTVPNDLFKHLKAHWPTPVNVDLDEFFYDWTEQVGFPVLYVSVDAQHRIHLSQERFLLDPSDGSNPQINYTIPITYATDMNANFDNLAPRLYLNKHSKMIITTDKAIKWIIFNLQQSNYYRVLYDTPQWRSLQAALQQYRHSGIPPSNRAQLVDDSLNFGRVGKMEYAFVFEFLEYLFTDVDYLPWYAMFKELPRIANRLTLQQQKNFGKYLEFITKNVFIDLAFPSNDHTVLQTYNRKQVISWACKYRLHDCGKKMRAQFDLITQTGRKPRPDFRETLYCSACRDGVFSYYQKIHEWFNAEILQSEKEKLIRAMGCTRFFYEFHYALILNGEIPVEYAVMGITPMYTQNTENVTPVFLMLTETIERLAARLNSWSSVANVISDIANYFTTTEQKELLKKFIAEKGQLFGSDISKLNAAVDTVESNLKWAEARLARLNIYLEERNAANVRSVATALMVLLGAIYALLQ